MLKQVLQVASPAGAGARLSVLIFHRVLPQTDPLFPQEIDAARFDAICSWLRRWFDVLPLDAALQRLYEGSLPARACAITFDDGYADNHDLALPVLRRHGLPATFFVATGFLDGGRMWNDTIIESLRRTTLPAIDLSSRLGGGWAAMSLDGTAARRAAIERAIAHAKYLAPIPRMAFVEQLAGACRAALPSTLMMTSAQVRALATAGMTIGAHTVSHPILARLGDVEARHEIAEGRAHLQQISGQCVSLFAYPNGKPGDDYLPRDVRLVRELGFEAAVSTAWGAASQTGDRWQVPRFTPWDRGRVAFGARLVRNLLARPHSGLPEAASS